MHEPCPKKNLTRTQAPNRALVLRRLKGKKPFQGIGSHSDSRRRTRRQNPPHRTDLNPNLPMPAAMTGGMGSGPRSLDCRSFWKAGASEAPSAPAREFHGSSSAR
jgi:hypothetical protein